MLEKRKRLHKPDCEKAERWNVSVSPKTKKVIQRLSDRLNDGGRSVIIKGKSDFLSYATNFLDKNIDELGAKKNEIKADISRINYKIAELTNQKEFKTKQLCQLSDPGLEDAYRVRIEAVKVFNSKPKGAVVDNE